MAEVAHLNAPPAESIPDQLRALAERIEAGEFGEVLSVSWVADCGSGHVETALIGLSPLPGAHLHLMLAMGMRKLELLGE